MDRKAPKVRRRFPIIRHFQLAPRPNRSKRPCALPEGSHGPERPPNRARHGPAHHSNIVGLLHSASHSRDLRDDSAHPHFFCHRPRCRRGHCTHSDGKDARSRAARPNLRLDFPRHARARTAFCHLFWSAEHRHCDRRLSVGRDRLFAQCGRLCF